MVPGKWFRGYVAVLAVMALLAVILGTFFLLYPRQEAEPAPTYRLRDNGGKVALFAADGTGPLAEYDIYTRLLPREEALALQQGVNIRDEAELQQRLEDLGL